MPTDTFRNLLRSVAVLTYPSDQLKNTQRLIEALKPGADIHERRDGEALKARMREVEQLVGSLSTSVTAEWGFCLETAVRGILHPRPSLVKKTKPELNMADDERIDYGKEAIVDDDWYE